MSYTRVIPRDFFNEAKLLKCMGVLFLDYKLPEGIRIEIEDNGEAFDIQLTDCGSLYISNYNVTINGNVVTMKTTYNSKSNFPLLCEVDYIDYPVFNEDGTFHNEFIEAFKITNNVL